MVDNKDVKAARLNGVSNISRTMYNFTIGATLLWGFFLNAVLTVFFSEQITNLFDAAPLAVLIGYLIVSFASIWIIHKFDAPAISFLGFSVLSLAMGMVIAVLVPEYTGGSVVAAIVLTMIVVVGMTLLAMVVPSFFASIGRGLFIGLIATLVVEVIYVLIFGTGNLLINIVYVAIFSLYIGYDYVRSQQYALTIDNAIDSAADIYIDVVNLFIRLLAIFGDRR